MPKAGNGLEDEAKSWSSLLLTLCASISLTHITIVHHNHDALLLAYCHF